MRDPLVFAVPSTHPLAHASRLIIVRLAGDRFNSLIPFGGLRILIRHHECPSVARNQFRRVDVVPWTAQAMSMMRPLAFTG